jgi:hypothetical protein
MIDWLKSRFTSMRLPVMDHGDMTHKEFWYLDNVEPMSVGGGTDFRPPTPSDLFEIHFDQRDHYSPKYEDPYYNTRYKFSKHGKTKFTHAESVEILKWLAQKHEYAHD